MKIVKKYILSFLVAIGLLIFMPFLTVNAADEVKLVYANVPADWENPCIWAWDADGNSAFEAWPGKAMEKDENNEGWYYIYVPAGMSNVIVNANEGSIQTPDSFTNNEDAWITVNSNEDVTITNEKLTNGDAPAYVSTYKVYAKVDASWIDPCLWAWSAPDGTNVYANWPGEELTANADGFYSAEIPTWVNSVIINGNAGTVQTADISVEAKDLWLVVAADGVYELFYEKPAVSADEMITVHASVPSDWLLPNLWAWSAPDGTNVFANWPGEELVQNGDWYTYDIPNWVNSVIVNGNLGTIQTSDISIEKGKDIWVVVKSAEEYELYYEEPSMSVETAKTEVTKEVADQEVPTASTSVEKKSNVIPVIIAVIVAVAGGVVFIFVRKKKEN